MFLPGMHNGTAIAEDGVSFLQNKTYSYNLSVVLLVVYQKS